MATKTYNPYSDILENYKLKSSYDEAKKKNDKAAMKSYAASAEQARKRLTDAGYGAVAEQLKATDTAGAKALADKYSTFGKSALRPYLKSSKLVTQYGYTPEEIDDLITFNNATKEISFGGKNIGVADTIVDGTSYFTTDYLDKLVNDIAESSGRLPTEDYLRNLSNNQSTENAQTLFDKQMATNKDINSKFEELYGYSMDTDPFKTAVGKSIMKEYNLKALQGRDNEAASGAAGNSGNIDSFSAANALRQQAALTSQGQQMVIADQAQRVNNVLATLSGMTDSNVKQDTSMQNTIALQQNQGSRLFSEAMAPIQLAAENKQKEDELYYELAGKEYEMLTESQKQAVDSVFKMIESGNVPTQQMLYNAGFEGMSGEEMRNNYMKLKAKSGGSGGGSGGGSNGDYSDMSSYAALLSYYSNGMSPTANGTHEAKMASFVQDKLKPYFEGKKKIEGETGFNEIKNLIIQNTEKYNIDIDDARLILSTLGFEGDDYYTWLDDYEDRTGADAYKGFARKGT